MDELVNKARAGDAEAFSRLARELQDGFYRAAWSILRSDADAADAMQEATIRCWLKLPELRDPARFKTWATRILVNECYALARKRRANVAMEDAPEPSAAEQGYDKAEWQMLLAQLPERSSTVVTLHYVEGYKVSEVADIMGASANTVKTWLATARAQYEALVSQ